MILRIFLACLTWIVLSVAASAQGLVLRNDVIVYKDIVTVGDLFDNAGVHAETPLFRSPDIGYRGTVPVLQILGRMLELGVSGIDRRGLKAVEVTRASQYLTGADFMDMTKRAIAERLGDVSLENIDMQVDSLPGPINADAGADIPVSLRSLDYSARSGRFLVKFMVDNGTRRLEVNFRGSALETRRAVVLVRPIGRGELIAASDVIEARLNARNVLEQSAVTPDQLVGMEARRNLRDNVAINLSDVQLPTLVERNQTVTITYKSASLFLSSQGRALSAGSKHDLISVLNIQSNRTVQGRVVASGEVVVSPPTLRLAAVKE